MKKIVLLLLLFSVLSVNGEKLFIEETGISLWLPDSWEKTIEVDYLLAESPDKKALFICELLDSQTLDEALSEYPEVLSEYFDQLKIEKNFQNLKIIEQEALRINASGNYQGNTMQIAVYLLESEESIILLVCASDKLQVQNFSSIFDQVLQSMEKKVEQKN